MDSRSERINGRTIVVILACFLTATTFVFSSGNDQGKVEVSSEEHKNQLVPNLGHGTWIGGGVQPLNGELPEDEKLEDQLTNDICTYDDPFLYFLVPTYAKYCAKPMEKMKKNLALHEKLGTQLAKLSLEEGSADSDQHQRVLDTIRDMGQVLARGNNQLFDCKLITDMLGAVLQTAVENPYLFHYALFSDNVLVASLVVRSTVMNAQDPSQHVFHLVIDTLNFRAMSMWFRLNPPEDVTIQAQRFRGFSRPDSSYSSVLRQLESAAMKKFYFKTARSESVESGSENLKYRYPKYMSMLNHLRFYIPRIFPKLEKILFLDDDVVVQKDLTPLWSIDLKGKVNGAVETCGVTFHRLDTYLNFSDKHISDNFDPKFCGWAYGMNIFDLKEWKKNNITETYHFWQNLNENRTLWKLGTLPPGLITFYNLTQPLQSKWHLLGLGYDKGIDANKIERSAVIHYNGHMKPWTEMGISKYQPYWTKYINFDHPYIFTCRLFE